jgi:hypothetical protein
VRKTNVQTLPGQLDLFTGEALEACTISTLGVCPKCTSMRVFIQRRVRVFAAKICGACGSVWGGPEVGARG